MHEFDSTSSSTDFTPFWQSLQLLTESNLTTQRLFHGRGHCFAGLEFINADFFNPAGLLQITLYDQPVEGFTDQLVEKVAEYKAVKALVVQHRYLPKAPSEWLIGDTQDKLEIEEEGLKYWVYPGQQQNIGFFIDMAEGRKWVRSRTESKNVLNLFAYTCAFSVAAIEGGAEQVVNLDMSNSSLSKGRENHRLNEHELNRVKFLGHDLFKSWGKLKKFGPYDLFIIDPPSFQKGSFVATKDYQRVLRRLPEIAKQGADILLCLNDPTIECQFLLDLMTEHCPEAKYVERLGLPKGFNEVDMDKGLKTLVFTMP